MADKIITSCFNGGIFPLAPANRPVDVAGTPIKVEPYGSGCILFAYTDVTKSLTDAHCNVLGTSDPVFLVARAGIIVAVGGQLNATLTAGVATIQPLVNGSEVGSGAIDVTLDSTHQRDYEVASSAVSFVAGDLLGIHLTTNSAIDPETTDLVCMIWYQFI